MRMIVGAVLILAAAVCLSGYQIANAVNQFSGGPLPFLGWVFGLGGIAVLAQGWMESVREASTGEKASVERKK